MRHLILALTVSVCSVGMAGLAEAGELPVSPSGSEFARDYERVRRLELRECAIPRLETLAFSDARPASDTYCRLVKNAPRKRWSVVVAAYLWGAGIKGEHYADGERSDIDVSFSDLVDKLDYGFMGYVEGRYDKWSFAVDASTLKLTDSRGGPLAGLANLDATVTQTIVDLRLGYSVLSCKKGGAKWGRCCYPRLSTLDAIVGARHWDVNAKVDISGPAGGGVTILDRNSEWWDPYVGARWRWQWAKRWGLTLYGDIGGFGIGDSSELTWQLQAYVRYHITRGLFLTAGYRALDVDRVTGSGATRNGIDATYHGPVLGLGYIF